MSDFALPLLAGTSHDIWDFMGGTQWVAIVVPNYLFIVGESPKEPNSAACRGGPERSLSIAFIHGKRVKNQPDLIHHDFCFGAVGSWGRTWHDRSGRTTVTVAATVPDRIPLALS